MYPFPPGKVLQVAFLAHSDNRNLDEVALLTFGAARPFAKSQWLFGKPVAVWAPVPPWKAKARDFKSHIGCFDARPTGAMVRW